MKYKYKPLSAASRGIFSIRLLYLLPAQHTKNSASLNCRLVETEIANYDLAEFESKKAGLGHVKYQALSYTWGSPVFPHSLHVLSNDTSNDVSQKSSLGDIPITENLHSALCSLRRPTGTLVLWVDAVCIDQENVIERNSQVANFPKTYAGATSVLVWLGPDDSLSHGKLCLNFFADLAALILGDPMSESNTDDRSWRKRFMINQAVSAFLDDDASQSRPITSLLQRPWFKRRWIIQEVVMAKDVWVHYGATSIHWNTFEQALAELFYNDKDGFSDEHRTILQTMSLIRSANGRVKRQAPLDTLVEFDSFECSNPRDRLYALYGVMQHWFPKSAGMQVLVENIDYGLPIRDVFTDFAIHMMRVKDEFPLHSNYDSTTHVLQLAGALRPMLHKEMAEQVPSWVPDWTGTMHNRPLYHSPLNSDASSGIPQQQIQTLTLRDSSRALVTVGLVHDVIKAVIPLDIQPPFGTVYGAKNTLNNFLCSIAKSFDEIGFFPPNSADIYHHTGQHIISAIAVTLVANWEHTPTNSYFAQDARFLNQFLEQLRSSRHHLPEILHKWPAYAELVTITMRGRSLMLTESGYIGICDTNVRVGDVVGILSGTRIPFILRRKSLTCASVLESDPSVANRAPPHDEKGSTLKNCRGMPTHNVFELLGDAYIHALMNGEAAGSLGERFENLLQTVYIV